MKYKWFFNQYVPEDKTTFSCYGTVGQTVNNNWLARIDTPSFITRYFTTSEAKAKAWVEENIYEQVKQEIEKMEKDIKRFTEEYLPCPNKICDKE